MQISPNILKNVFIKRKTSKLKKKKKKSFKTVFKFEGWVGFILLEKKKRFCFVLFCFLIDAILPGLGNCKVLYCGEYWLKKRWNGEHV